MPTFVSIFNTALCKMLVFVSIFFAALVLSSSSANLAPNLPHKIIGFSRFALHVPPIKEIAPRSFLRPDERARPSATLPRFRRYDAQEGRFFVSQVCFFVRAVFALYVVGTSGQAG